MSLSRAITWSRHRTFSGKKSFRTRRIRTPFALLFAAFPFSPSHSFLHASRNEMRPFDALHAVKSCCDFSPRVVLLLSPRIFAFVPLYLGAIISPIHPSRRRRTNRYREIERVNSCKQFQKFTVIYIILRTKTTREFICFLLMNRSQFLYLQSYSTRHDYN